MRVLFVVFALLGFVLVPSAQAQYASPVVSVTASTDGTPVMPDTGQAKVRIQITVRCPYGYLSVQPTEVHVKMVHVPPFANVVIEPSRHVYQYQPQDCLQGMGGRTFTSYAIVTVTRDAPAYYDGHYEVLVSVQQPGPLYSGNAQAVGAFLLKNGYVADVHVNPGLLQATTTPGGEASLPFEVTNLGNGPTRTHIDIEQDGPDRLAIVNPGADLRLESKAGRGASAMFKASRTIDVVAGPDNGAFTFTAIFRSGFDGVASEATSTDETRIRFSVLVEGVANQTRAAEATTGDEEPAYLPTPMVPIVALLLLGLAALRRRLL